MRDLRAAWEDDPDEGEDEWADEDEELDFDDGELDFGDEDPDDADEEVGDEGEDFDDEELDEDGIDLADLDDLDDEVLELDADEGSELTGSVAVFCPYCGARVEMIVDPVGGDVQEYVEDCEVCCQPWSVRVTLDRDGSASVELGTLDEG